MPKKAGMKQGCRDTEARGGWMWNKEHASASCILPSQHAQTNHPAIPQQRGDHHSTQMYTDILSKVHGANAPKPGQWVEHKSNNHRERERKRVPCSAFRCARPWKEKANREERNRERRWKQRHANTTVVLFICMLCMMANHDDHSESKAFPRAFESFLLWETNNYRAATYANIKLFTLEEPLPNDKTSLLDLALNA